MRRGVLKTGGKTCRKSQNFAEIHKKQLEINEKVRVLGTIFMPTCAFCAKKICHKDTEARSFFDRITGLGKGESSKVKGKAKVKRQK